MSTAVYPGGAPNTYVPEATKNFQIEFSRNPKKFAVAEYAQIVPVDKSVGYYLEITAEEAGRILDADLANHAWPDGAFSPDFNNGTESFKFEPYQCRRRAYGYNLGDLAIDEASWDVHAQMGRTKAQQCMTARTVKVAALAQATGTYAAAHTSAILSGSIPGTAGRWDQSTTARGDIQRSIEWACELILKDSLGMIEPEDLQLVMSPNCARQISLSQELIDHVKGSPEAWAMIRGDMPQKHKFFNMPLTLFGVNVCIDQTVKVTSRKGATKATSFVIDSTKPFICSRKGGVVGSEQKGDGQKVNFSTFSLFMKEEMTVEQHRPDQGWHRMSIGRVVDNYDAVATAPVTGFLFTSAVDSSG